MEKIPSSSVATVSLRGILFHLLILIIAYFLFYLVAFDRQQPSLDRRTGQVEFRSSPRWARSERLPFNISLYGIRTSFWNTLFAPAERLWFSIVD